jgi:hypothetical protein
MSKRSCRTDSAHQKKGPAFLRGQDQSRQSYFLGALPVPVRLAVCGLLVALSDTLNVPVVTPTAVGVKTTSIVQVADEVKVAVQVVEETLKAPVVEITMFLSSTLW